MPERYNDLVVPYINAIPKSKKPVAKEPIKKYFSAASFERKFLLSEPVSTYMATDKISKPTKSMMRLSKETIKSAPTNEKSKIA